jgi:hypothetical protein
MATALLALLSWGGCGTFVPGRAVVETPLAPEDIVAFPNLPDSLKFAVLGDFGTGDREQFEMAEQMALVHSRLPFTFVLLVGDNIYGSERPQDFRQKFEEPYRGLLDAGVRFYASLGNHDSREQRYYDLFNMDGELYYSFSPGDDVRFFALESTYMEPEQIEWLEAELEASNDLWKIAFFHHPLYSSAGRHGSDVRLREAIEPILRRNGVSVVFAGHDHVYERIKPQHGIVHFVVGSGGKLRRGDIDPRTGLTARGFDANLAFLVAEIEGDALVFQAVSRSGAVVDSGIVTHTPAAGAGEERAPAISGQP